MSKYYRKNRNDKTLWLVDSGTGEHLFTFDKETVYNLFSDYPWKLKPEEIEIFDRENPFWAEFFSDRKI